MNTTELILSRLKTGFPGITPALGQVFFEACLVCLEHNHHNSGTQLQVNGDFQKDFRLVWDDSLTGQIRRAWHDFQEATEFAAMGIALLLVDMLTDYTIIQRAQKGSGFDYWLSNKEKPDLLPFQYTAKLEVSGILKADNVNLITARVQQKRKQAKIATSQLPTYVVVVEFSRPLAFMVNK